MRPHRSPVTRLLAVAAVALVFGAGCGKDTKDVASGAGDTTTTTVAPAADSSAACAEPTTTVASDVMPDPGGIASDLPAEECADTGGGTVGDPGDGSSTDGSPGKDDPGTVDPDEPVSTIVPPDEPDGPPDDLQPTLVKSRDDLVNPQISEPERVSIDPADDRLVHVRFWGGVESCYGANVTVKEMAASVTVTLRTGGVPGSEGKACIDIAQYMQIDVRLSAPLGDRKLVPTTLEVNQPTAEDQPADD